MIVFSCSLDSSLAQAKLQGGLQALEERYHLFRSFDRVVLLTQDTQDFDHELTKITQVSCAYSKFEIARVILSQLKLPRWLYFSFSSFLWLLRNRREVNLVISENVDSPTPFLFSSMFRIPFYIHYHYDVAAQVGKINKRAFQGMLLHFLEKLCFKKAACIWVTSANLVEKAEALGAHRVTLIPNWIDFNEELKSQLEFPELETRILFVGRLHPVKRVHLLLKAFDLLRKVYPHVSLNIIGDGEERQNLMTLAKNLELNECVQFLGFQSHEKVLDMMRRSNMIVLPSKMEGNPRVLIEAMMLKVPIVATSVPGIRDIVQHAETGHLIVRALPEDLALAMGYVLSNRRYAVRIAENAYAFARQQFSREQVLKKIREDIFSTVPSYRENISLRDRMALVKHSPSSISVIIPAYNAEKTLERCLSSVIQAFPREKEVIVVDDGSTDLTYKIASELPVRLLRLDKNNGTPTAKNLGLVQASGDIVAFVDSDCIVEKSYFTELVSVLNGRESTVGGVGGVICPLQSNLVSDSFNVRFFGCSPSSETKIREIDSLGGACAYAKELLMKIGGFDASIGGGEDLDLNVRLRKAGYRLLVVPFAKAYHLHPTSLRQLARKWFSYGRFLVDVSVKNGLKKDVALTWGWVSSFLVLFAISFFTRQLFAWLLLLLALCLPWILHYSRQTAKFWIRNRKARYLALPFIHQVVIVSRSLGVVVATLSYLFKTQQE